MLLRHLRDVIGYYANQAAISNGPIQMVVEWHAAGPVSIVHVSVFGLEVRNTDYRGVRIRSVGIVPFEWLYNYTRYHLIVKARYSA